MREVYEASVATLAKPLRGLRVLLWGFSGAGFPGGDGALEAADTLSRFNVFTVYTHRNDPEVYRKLMASYDVAIVCGTNVGQLKQAPRRLWRCAGHRVLWFWDLRPGTAACALRGLVDKIYLTYDGDWVSPALMEYSPDEWRHRMKVPIGYCPQASPMRDPVAGPEVPRVVFVGDLKNLTYHAGRLQVCKALDTVVMNSRDREWRLAIEAAMPRVYRRARYSLSMSPLAPGYTSVRTYSILACGGLLLLQRFPGVERLFQDGTHAVIFDDVDHARERITELDADPCRRRQIAAQGRWLHATKHTVTHRILSMCYEAAGLSQGFAGWL